MDSLDVAIRSDRAQSNEEDIQDDFEQVWHLMPDLFGQVSDFDTLSVCTPNEEGFIPIADPFTLFMSTQEEQQICKYDGEYDDEELWEFCPDIDGL